MTPREGQYAVKLLLSRNGTESIVTLSNGAACRVLNVIPGRDAGDEYDHITAFIAEPDGQNNFFYASEVREIATDDGTVLFRSTTNGISN
jgi:hypothetical protein